MPDTIPIPHDDESAVQPTLLQRVAGGERAAMGACIDQYKGLVWSLARRYLPNQSDCEDAVQDVFLDLWRSAKRFDPDYRSETVFVAMIARRRVIDKLRSITRVDTVEWTDVASDAPTNDPSLCAEAGLIREHMQQLKPEERQVLDLGVVLGYSHSQIADKLAMPLGTVKSHMRRGLMRVQQWLNAGGDA